MREPDDWTEHDQQQYMAWHEHRHQAAMAFLNASMKEMPMRTLEAHALIAAAGARSFMKAMADDMDDDNDT